MHASYLHVHWAGHPQLAQRFADAVHAASPRIGALSVVEEGAPATVSKPRDRVADPLRHHGDAEVRDAGLLDFAVNVYAGPRPLWLEQALRASIDEVDSYPSAAPAEAALADRHGLTTAEVLATAGAAEAFTLIARARPWRRAVVVHPQFTEPHAALEQAGHHVTEVLLPPPFMLDPTLVPDDADLVVIGNPTNPTGVLHTTETLRGLRKPGRLVVVDEAFMDTVPGESETLVGEPGFLVVRSLTKHWSIPGVRAGYVTGAVDVVADLRTQQTPWSVSTAAASAIRACSTPAARAEAERRAHAIAGWRDTLTGGLDELAIPHIPSRTSFVLAQLGAGGHAALRGAGIAVRRADTFPGLDATWVRMAVRRPGTTDQLLVATKSWRDTLSPGPGDALG
jgi:cobyrinic acid a,c-diamide synthase